MLVDATAAEAEAIVRAMRDVATAGGTVAMTDADRIAVRAAHHYVFRAGDELDVDGLAPITPAELAAAIADQRVRDHATSFLVVVATVDGSIDQAKIARVEQYATALGSSGDEVKQLGEAAAGHLAWVLADMARQNALSITGHALVGAYGDWLQPYTAKPDPALAERYEALASAPQGSFGAAFHAFYKDNGFTFPARRGRRTSSSPRPTTAPTCSAATAPHRRASCWSRRSPPACTRRSRCPGTSCP